MPDQPHDLSRLTINRDAPSPRARRALWRNAVLAGVAAVLVAGVVWTRSEGRPLEVEVTRVEVVGGGSGSVGITANGYVVARTKASVSSKISGRLEFLGVSEGSVVRRGEVIASLENRDYEAAVAQAEAERVRAEAAWRETIAQRDQLRRDLARAEDLFARDLDAKRTVEDLQAQVAAAEARVGVQEAMIQAADAAVAVARANFENTRIRAPFDGTVLRKDAEVGEVVAPVATGGGLTRGAVVTMADLETLEVEVDVNEAYIGQIKSDQPTRIVLDAYPEGAYTGAVRQIVPTADRQRATVQVKVSILDADERILPEMGARVEFLQDTASDVVEPTRLFVAAAAVRQQGGEDRVWVVRDGVATPVTVDAGPVSGGRREIRRGLTGGETVIVDPPLDLAAGSAVRARAPDSQSDQGGE